MRNITIEFENLTKEELEALFKLEDKMKIDGAVMTGTGFDITTRTRDWGFELNG